MNYGIAVFPSEEIQQFATPYRKRYDSHDAIIRPHLTIRESQEWTHDELNEATAELRRIAASLEPFDIHFNRFATFHPVSSVIYMALSSPEQLQQLHTDLCSGPLLMEREKPYSFVPHLTIAQGLPEDELLKAYAALQAEPLNLICTVDRFALLRQEASGAWTLVSEFLLGGPAA